MYPEAGGSSSFARRAFNEFWSFFAAWGQMLNYVITIAISAFFVPHYLGSVIGVDALRHGPGDIIFGIGVVALLAVVNVRGAEESAGGQHRAGARRLRHPAAAGPRRPVPGLLARDAGRQHQLRRRADLEAVLPGDPGGDDRLHGHRDDLEHGRGGQGRVEDDPGGDQARGHRGLRHLRPAAGRGAQRAARRPGRHGRVLHAAGPHRGPGRLRRRSRARAWSRTWTSASSRGPTEIYVGLLAATILFIATNAGIIGVSRLVYSMGLHRQVPDPLRQLHPRHGTPWIGILVFGAIACLTHDPRQGRVPGQHVRVRGDAVVHHRPHLGGPAALHPARPPAALPRPGADPGRPRPRAAALRGARRAGHRAGLRRGHRAARRRGRSPAWPGWRSA